MLKSLLVVVAAVLLTLLLALSMLHLSPERSIRAIERAVNALTNLNVELVEPSINVFERTANAEEIHLYQDGTRGPALISIIDFSAITTLGDLFTLDLDETTLTAASVIVYISKSDDTADPQPATWLGYTKLLPASLTIGTLHLISQDENVWIFPVKDLTGVHTSEQLFNASAQADYDGEPLNISLNIQRPQDGASSDSLKMSAKFDAARSKSTVSIGGEVKGDDKDFQYDYDISADYKKVEDFLSGFSGVTQILDGALTIEGKLTGNLSGFELTAKQIVLDNMPAYGLEAGGKLSHQFGTEETAIKLVASGEFESAQQAIFFTDLDLSALGKTQASITLSGTLQVPVVDNFVLRSKNNDGLAINLSGQLGTKEVLDGVLSPNSKIRADISAPSLSVLDKWLGPQPVELGHWQASALLQGSRDAVRVDSIILEIGDSRTMHVRARGSIERVDLAPPFSLKKIQNIAAKLSLDTKDSAIVGTWLDLPVPNSHLVYGEADISGSGDQLLVSNGTLSVSSSDLEGKVSDISALITSEESVALRNAQGLLNVTLSDTSALSQYAEGAFNSLGKVQGTGELKQTDTGFELNSVKVNVEDEDYQISLDGHIENLNAVSGADFNLRFAGLKTSDFVSSQISNYSYSRDLGKLEGSMRLQWQADEWQVSNLSVANKGNESLILNIRGSLNNAEGLPRGDLQADIRTKDASVISEITGLKLADTSATITVKTSPGKALVDVDGVVGSSTIKGSVSLAYAEKKLKSLGLDITIPHLSLTDFGLQTDVGKGGDYRPGEKLDPITKDRNLESLLTKAPRIDTDIAIEIGGLSGEFTRIKELDLHVVGKDKSYTLRKFDVIYETGHMEVRGIIDLNPDPIAVSLAGLGFTVPMDKLRRDLAIETSVLGDLTFRGGITARGNRQEELVQSMNGSLALALEDAVLQGAAYDLLATNTLEWIYSGAALKDSTEIDCTMASFSIVDGVASTNDLFLETKHMIAKGDGDLDFVKRHIDISITPRSKSRAFNIPSSVRIRGEMSKPKTILSPVAATANASTEAIMLVPNLVLKMFGVKKGARKRTDPCLPKA
ncbi:MAG: AsmA-like C-terminal region-containing protein [Halioglobus sp.]